MEANSSLSLLPLLYFKKIEYFFIKALSYFIHKICNFFQKTLDIFHMLY